MKLEITFEELNGLIEHYTEHNISVKPLQEKDTFLVCLTIGVFPIAIPLTFDRIIDGHQLTFDYKLPFGMNRLAGKFKETLSSLIPRRIAEIDHRQIVVHLTRIKSMERYFEHFEVSHFEPVNNSIKLIGKLKNENK